MLLKIFWVDRFNPQQRNSYQFPLLSLLGWLWNEDDDDVAEGCFITDRAFGSNRTSLPFYVRAGTAVAAAAAVMDLARKIVWEIDLVDHSSAL